MIRRLGIISHDARKKDCRDWVKFNMSALKSHEIYSTGTTGKILKSISPELNITSKNSGIFGGDFEIGAMIANHQIDMIIFFIDHLSLQPHDPDIKGLIRLAGLYNIPTACNRATADYILSSPLFTDETYKPIQPDFDSYINRDLKI